MSTSPKFYLWKRNGTYYIGYPDEHGKRHWKSAKCHLKNEALKKLSEFKELLRLKPKAKTLSHFTSEFLIFAETTYARPTVDIFKLGLRNLLTIAGDCLLTELTPQHIDLYKSARLKAVSPTTVNVEVRGLRAVMNTALRWKFLDFNPFNNVPLLRISEVPPIYFSKLDFQKLISTIKENWLREMVLIAVLTGMRRGEIVNLRWQDVDLQSKIIHIQSNPTFKTKQGKRRTIPISDVALHVLRSRFGQSISDYVFSLKESKVKESLVSHKFKEYTRIAGVEQKLHFHSLRHTFATWLVQDGVSLYEVQKLLGHSNIAVTQIYSHLQPEGLHQTVNRISLVFN